MTVLVLGGGGQIARAVCALAPLPGQVVLKTRGQLDIGDAAGVARALQEIRPSWVINGAAYTAVDLAEDQPEQAMAVNDTAVGIVANATAQAGSRLLHLSTDFVFDGKSNRAYLPHDQTNPLSVYGVSKLGGERECPPGSTIVRTSWVCGAHGKNMVKTALRLAEGDGILRFGNDQRVSPTFTADLAPALVTGSFDSSRQKAAWPSTGNFCRGGAFNSALLGCFRVLNHKSCSTHADDHAVPAAVEWSGSLFDHIVGRCRSASQKACAHPFHQMVGSNVVRREDNHTMAASGADPVLRQRHGLRGARTGGIDLRVGATGSYEFSKLRMAHGKSSEKEPPVENIGLFFNRGAQLFDAAIQFLQKVRVAIRFDHSREQALQSCQLLAAGMVRVIP